MKPVKHYKPNVVYELLIHGVYHYAGCHCVSGDHLVYGKIIHNSGNYLTVALKKGLITRKEYEESIELINVWEFDTRQEALDFETLKIQELKEKYGDLCKNKALYGNRHTTKGLCVNLGKKQSSTTITKRVATIKEKYANGYVSPRKGKAPWNKGITSNLFWFTNGKTTILAKECPKGFRRGRI